MSKIVVDTIESTGATVTVNDALTTGTNAITAGSVTGLSASSLTTGTLPNAQLADGHILQVVQTVFTGEFDSGTTGSWVAIPGMSASITPSSTDSKILVMIQSSSGNSTSTGSVQHSIYRGGSQLTAYIGAAAGSRNRTAAAISNPGTWNQANFSLIYLDSPSTTSATTYQLYSESPNATWRINGNGEDSDANNQWRSASSVTLMEIKA
jgi:hypothetical protein